MAGSVPKDGSNKKVANSLIALSSAAVLAVYSAGYVRTKSAADRLAVMASERRPARAAAATPIARVLPPAPAASAAAPPPAAPSPVAAPEIASAPVPAAAADAAPSPSEAPASTAAEPARPSVAVSTQAPIPAPVPTAPVYKDGTYYAWGSTSIHGDLQAVVVIEGGKITYAEFEKCHTRYSCNVIGELPYQVVIRQSAEVDMVSGATESADAFHYAVMKALDQAK